VSMARTDSAAGWYCIKAKPGGISTALRVLPTLAGVEGVFHPKVIYMKPTAYGLRRRAPALFPGYLFCRFPWEIWNRVSFTSGVAGIVRRAHGELVEVPQPAMMELFDIAPDGNVHLDDLSFHVGQRVRIIAGAFNFRRNAEAANVEIVGLAPEKKRVTVLLTLLGDERAVNVRREQIDLPTEQADPRVRAIGWNENRR